MQTRMIPIVMTAMLTAAHFMRAGSLILVLLCLSMPFLLGIKKRWSLRVIQAFAIVSALVWLLTLWGIIGQRIIENRSWTASAIILGTVSLFSLFSGWLLNAPRIREKYPPSGAVTQ